jgi:hypothetical protein
LVRTAIRNGTDLIVEVDRGVARLANSGADWPPNQVNDGLEQPPVGAVVVRPGPTYLHREPWVLWKVTLQTTGERRSVLLVIENETGSLTIFEGEVAHIGKPRLQQFQLWTSPRRCRSCIERWNDSDKN